MTAKEMLKDHKHLFHGYYVFEREDLETFLDQYSKEQRELDGDMYFEKTYISKGTYKMYDPNKMRKMIKENKQPEV